MSWHDLARMFVFVPTLSLVPAADYLPANASTGHFGAAAGAGADGEENDIYKNPPLPGLDVEIQRQRHLVVRPREARIRVWYYTARIRYDEYNNERCCATHDSRCVPVEVVRRQSNCRQTHSCSNS